MSKRKIHYTKPSEHFSRNIHWKLVHVEHLAQFALASTWSTACSWFVLFSPFICHFLPSALCSVGSMMSYDLFIEPTDLEHFSCMHSPPTHWLPAQWNDILGANAGTLLLPFSKPHSAIFQSMCTHTHTHTHQAHKYSWIFLSNFILKIIYRRCAYTAQYFLGHCWYERILLMPAQEQTQLKKINK